MGKTPKPLTLLVDRRDLTDKDREYFYNLCSQGHTIEYMDEDFDDYDAIISTKAWFMIPEMNENNKLYDMMIKAIRKSKYPPTKKGKV